MTKEQISELIINEVEDMIYIIDMESYEMLYMNEKAKHILGFTDDDEWKTRKCYEVVHGEECVCECCPNSIVREKGFYAYERYNHRSGKLFYQKYKLITFEGRKAKLVVSIDISELRKTANELNAKLNTERTMLKCVKTLYEVDDMGHAINQLLEIIAQFYSADRAYIFEFDDIGYMMDNTYEWCGEDISSSIKSLKNIEITVIDRWIKAFEESGEIVINSVENELDKTSVEYKLLKAQGIEMLMAAPLYFNHKIVGFLGVDNPRANTDSLVVLQTVAAFVVDDIFKQKNLAELYRLSYHDKLTGVGNRHAYVKCMESLEKNAGQSLGILFADINGLKKANDLYGHEHGDYMIKTVAKRLQEYFKENVFRVGGDEFVVFCPGVAEEAFKKMVEDIKNYPSSDVVASIGMIWTSECANVEMHVAQADEIMYKNKQEYYKNQK